MKGINILALRYRLPHTILADAGSAFTSIEANIDLYQALLLNGVKFICTNSGAQFANFCEARFKSVKKILTSLRTDMNNSIYKQNDTLINLQNKFLLTEATFALKPIYICYLK